MDSAQGRELRAALRRTWLADVMRFGHDYRFFLFDVRSGHDYRTNRTDTNIARMGDTAVEPADMVRLPHRFWRELRPEREMQLLVFAFSWTLSSLSAASRSVDFIVKADHDTYVCVDHLAHDLESRPRERFFAGLYWNLPRPLCRADQFFNVYSPDVLRRALERHEVDPFWQAEGGHPALNWAKNWGEYSATLWARHELTVVSDVVRTDSQLSNYTPSLAQIQGQYGRRACARPVAEGPGSCAFYCASRLLLHLFAKGVHKDPKVLQVLHSNTQDFHSRLRLRGGGESGLRWQYPRAPAAVSAPSCLASQPQPSDSRGGEGIRTTSQRRPGLASTVERKHAAKCSRSRCDGGGGSAAAAAAATSKRTADSHHSGGRIVRMMQGPHTTTRTVRFQLRAARPAHYTRTGRRQP